MIVLLKASETCVNYLVRQLQWRRYCKLFMKISLISTSLRGSSAIPWYGCTVWQKVIAVAYMLSAKVRSFLGSGRSEYCLLNLGRNPRIRCTRAKAIGINFRPPVQTIVDTCRYLVENNLISSPVSGGCVLM